MPPSTRAEVRATRPAHPRWWVRLLGPFRVDEDGQPVKLRPAEQRLLAVLCLAPGRQLDTETLIDRMWADEPPRTARASLQVHVSALRRALPGCLMTTSDGYRLEGIDDDRTEVEHIAGAIETAAAAAGWGRVAQLAEEALASWSGTSHIDTVDGAWATAEARRLEILRAQLVERELEALLELGRNSDAARLARREVARNPLDESSWRHLIRALRRDGRTAEALQAYAEVDERLRTDLGVPPSPALQDLELELRFGAGGGDASHALGALGLPVPGSRLIGRSREIADLAAALSERKIVGVIGPPGIGKTRLAVEVGRLTHDRYPAGVWFVPLSGARTARDVASLITTHARIRTPTRSLAELGEEISRRPTLVVIDNCEHVIDPVARFASAAASAAGPARIVTTSRHVLSVPGQHVLHLGPLELPPTTPRISRNAAIAKSPAVQLFAERAREADPTFRLNADTMPIVLDVCHSAAGIPLAIELAAGWLPAIGVADVREIFGPELTRRRPGRGDRRHASLEAAIERSLTLLAANDDRVIRRLSVFAGSFGLSDAHAVCDAAVSLGQFAASVARLVDASLVELERRSGGHARYRLLVPIRDYLRAAGVDNEHEVRGGFAEHYLAKANAWCPDPLALGTDLAGMDDDIDNVRESLEVGFERGWVDRIGSAILALEGYFYDRYIVGEAVDWLQRALDRVDERRPLRAWLLRALGSSVHNLGDLDGSASYLGASLRQFRRHGHRAGLALALLSTAQLHASRGAWALCGRDAERATSLLGARGNRSCNAVAAYYVGESHAQAGRIREALPLFERASRLFLETGQPQRAAYSLSTLVMMSVLGGFERPARRHAPRAVDLARQSGSAYRLCRALASSAAAEAAYGDMLAARELLEETRHYMSPLPTDVVVDFVLPSGFVLASAGRWDVLADVLPRAEAIASEHSFALPQPWQGQVRTWRSEVERRGFASSDAGSIGDAAADTLSEDILAVLRDGPSNRRRRRTPRSADPRARRGGAAARPGEGKTFGGVDVEGNTKEELNERARTLDIRGRSSMDKRELARAIARKQD